MILPFAVTWYGIFLMRQVHEACPTRSSTRRAWTARASSASSRRSCCRWCKPGLATLGIFVFIYHWNEVIWTMTVTRSAPELQTIPVGIYLLRGAFIDQSTCRCSRPLVVISILPVMVLFLLLQRYYVRGLVMSGLKG